MFEPLGVLMWAILVLRAFSLPRLLAGGWGREGKRPWEGCGQRYQNMLLEQ